MDQDRIRAATAADVSVIAEIVDQAYRHYISRIGKPPGPMLDDYAARVSEGAVWVLEEGNCDSRHHRAPPCAELSAPRQHRRFPHAPGLRIGPPAARVRGGRGIATRLSRNPALHA